MKSLIAVPFSRGSSQPRNQTGSPTLQVDSLPTEPPGKPKNTGVGSLSLLQGIFPTQESNQGFLHCRQILYQLSSQGRISSSFNKHQSRSSTGSLSPARLLEWQRSPPEAAGLSQHRKLHLPQGSGPLGCPLF